MSRAGSRAATAGIILAAGASSRLGEPKQLLRLDGRPLVQHVVDAASAAGLDPIVVVLGHAAGDVRAALQLPPGAWAVVNRDYRQGVASSLRAGLDGLPDEVGAAAILLGDQPTMAAETIKSVIDAAAAASPPIARARYGGAPGHPVVLRRSVWPLVRSAAGDAGARSLMAQRPELVGDVEFDTASPADIDTREDYEALLRR